MQIISVCNRAIEYLFYTLFFLVPLLFLPFNFELFEFNKMVATYVITVLIGFFWVTKMILAGGLRIQRTPLDIPILLFLTSQIISTIVSIDIHTSVWGYYSRSNGGLASMISYVFLYYAFVSNFVERGVAGAGDPRRVPAAQARTSDGGSARQDPERVKRLLLIALASGALVAFYGMAERLGIDKDYWVQDVQNRVFSTLGQPNWLAAYLSVLIPIAIVFAFKFKNSLFLKSFRGLLFLLFAVLLFTKSRSGFVGLGTGLLFFFVYLWKTQKSFLITNKQFFVGVLAFFAIITFYFGTPFEQLNKFTLPGIRHEQLISTKPQGPALEGGGTESGKIRQIVWKGALEIAKAYPLFGSGVETFAYSYYKFRPVEHNQTSEWDFLYNKAHNEYLNYLANTGFVGVGTYLLIIGSFLFISVKQLKTQMSKVKTTIQKSKLQNEKFSDLSFSFELYALSFALIAGYISILVSNFFGFSVVVTNLFFFLIPAFVFVLNGQLNPQNVFAFSLPRRKESGIMKYESWPSWILMLFLLFTFYFLLLYIVRMWDADRNYALGRSFSKAGEFSEAYPYLVSAIQERPGEPLFSEELSINIAALSIAAEEQNESTLSAQLINEAIRQSNYTIRKGPNNPGFWRTRIRVFYTLSQVDEKYTQDAEAAAKKTVELSPTDPKVAYNYALILGQTGNIDEAIKELERTVALKPDYRDPIYALGLFYYEKATDSKGGIVNQELFNKAIAQMENVLKLASDDAEATEKLKTWQGF